MRFGALLVLLFVVISSPAQSEYSAAPVEESQPEEHFYRHEFSLSGNESVLVFNDRGHTIALEASYSGALSAELQLGVSLSISDVRGSNDITVLSLLAGPTVNISINEHGITDAVFFSGVVGFTHVVSGGSATEFTFGLEAGKRFRLTDHVAMKPSIAIVKISGASLAFGVTPLSLTYLF